jgi:hypothetical protein
MRISCSCRKCRGGTTATTRATASKVRTPHHHWPEKAQHEFFAGENAACRLRHERRLRPWPPRQCAAVLFSDRTSITTTSPTTPTSSAASCIACWKRRPARCTATSSTWACSKAGRRRQTEALIECGEQFGAERRTGHHRRRLQRLAQYPQRPPAPETGRGRGIRRTGAAGAARRADWRYGAQWAGREKRLVPARTFPAALPWFRLDRIYVRGFKVDMPKCCTARSGRKLSDHAPIVANLQLA